MTAFTASRRIYTRSRGASDTLGDFVCAHCGAFVCANAELSGVKNRNHCPYCLSSRHLDHYEAGDRLSACKARMRPIGLTVKQTNKKYGSAAQGELMLIHQCEDCGKVSINRIAADDDNDLILALLEQSGRLEGQSHEGILPLGIAQSSWVRQTLFGRN